MIAVSRCGSALKYVSPNLKNNLKIVSLAIKRSESFLKYASPNLKKNY